MATSATIWNLLAVHGSPLANPHAMSSPTNASDGSSSAGDPSTITANDFLTLLVTEMQNQDPTNATDPNQYINQLVNVNSLQQLIQMNQTLAAAVYLLEQQGSGSGGTGGTGSGGSGSGDATGAANAATFASAQPGLGAHAFGSAPESQPPTTSAITSGNLGIPAANPSARRVAQALAGSAVR